MARLDRSKDWMEDALADLDHGRTAVVHRHYNWACFSAQQAAEKAVKAAFQRLGAAAWGHAVAELLRGLPAEWAAPQELVRKGLELDKAYVGARHADAHQAGSASSRYTPEEAGRMLGYAEEIVGFCEDLLSRAKPQRGD